jgi:glycerol kinase
MGAAYLAGLAVGTWASTDEIATLPRTRERFEPSMTDAERDRRYAGWQDAVARATIRRD